jgi:uncharacterized protein
MAEKANPTAELVEWMAKSLVDSPDEVAVTAGGGGSASIFKLTVDPADLGKIIGKKGRTAKAMRTVLMAVGDKQRRRCVLDIVEP